MKSIATEWVSVNVADGTQMAAYVARPEGGGQHPGLLVLQEIFGVNAHIRDITERFAREGYVALAPDLFHRLKPRYEGSYDDIPASIEFAMKLTPEGVTADLAASFAHLQSSPFAQRERIGVIGYCLGGRLAYLANTLCPLTCAVAYYGGGIQGLVDRAPALAGPMLLVWAGQDGYLPTEARRSVADALRAAGKTFVDVEFSDADHGFFCDARANYDPRAAAQVWPLTLAFLASHLR